MLRHPVQLGSQAEAVNLARQPQSYKGWYQWNGAARGRCLRQARPRSPPGTLPRGIRRLPPPCLNSPSACCSSRLARPGPGSRRLRCQAVAAALTAAPRPHPCIAAHHNLRRASARGGWGWGGSAAPTRVLWRAAASKAQVPLALPVGCWGQREGRAAGTTQLAHRRGCQAGTARGRKSSSCWRPGLR